MIFVITLYIIGVLCFVWRQRRGYQYHQQLLQARPETEVVRFMNAESNGSYYIDGNIMDGYPEYTQDNWSAVHPYPNYVKLETPASFANPLPDESADEAYEAVMQSAGATLPKRDAVDARIIRM